MILIVGLGNPGAKYKSTYHNVGFDVVDKVADMLKMKFSKSACSSRVAVSKNVVIAKPQTYMNLSGEAVRQLVRAYDIDPANELIVCYDDIDLPAGKLRLKGSGSAGTHNGMRNIVAELGTEDFWRVRVGTKTEEIAKHEVNLIDFVLSKRDYAYKEVFDKAIESAAEAICEMAKGTPFERVQEKANRKD